MIEIKHRWNGKVLYTAENAQDVRAALVEAAKERADLQGADLQGAYLQGADLQGADLQGADLRCADLQGADLQGAYLRGAYLQGADLQGADLQGAYLQGAYLQGAYLQGADLRGADHWRHPFWATRQDMFTILDQAPAEVAALRRAMVDGKINGSTYSDGACGCLSGTVGIVRAGTADGDAVTCAIRELGIQQDGSRPAEQWFIDIKLGDRPLVGDLESIDWKEHSESVFRLSWALKWLDEWVESRTATAKALVPDHV